MGQQEYMIKMQMLGQEAEQIEQQIQIIEQQNSELNSVRESLEAIKNFKEKEDSKEILANLGKGIFVKADLREKELLVNIGKDVLVKKTPEETIKIIDEQTKKLLAGKEQFIERIAELQKEMQTMLLKMQKHDNSGHSHRCENESCECSEPCGDNCECSSKK